MEKFEFASKNLTAGQLNAIVKNLGGEEGALRFLRGELVVQPAIIPEPIPELPLDFIIHVERSVKPDYPDWMKKVMHPELELTGTTEYDLQKLELWLHNDQKKGYAVGNTIYGYLEKGDALTTCLNLQDLIAIQAKGIKVFCKLFANKAVFAWKSVVQSSRGNLRVPYLIEGGGEVVLNWYWLDYDWGSDSPALRFSK